MQVVSSIRVLIADDHGIMRDGLKALIRNQEGMEVVGEAGTGQKTLELAEKLKPDVIVMDVKMPVMDGIEATRQIKRIHPDARVLALASELSNFTMRQAVEAGVTGFMLKESVFDEFTNAMESVTKDEKYLCPRARSLIASSYRDWLQSGSGPECPELTKQEYELVQLLTQGKSVGEIALYLNRSSKTIDARRRKTMNKLGLSSVAQLTKFAVCHGLTTLDY